MISPQKTLAAALILGTSIAQGAEVTKEQIPEVSKKLRTHLKKHEGNGKGMLRKDSPEQRFLYTYIREIESALAIKTSQERADTLKDLNTKKKTEYQIAVQTRQFVDDQDFKKIFETFLQISTGMEKTLREDPSITFTMATDTAKNVGKVLSMEDGTNALLAQSMGLAAPKNQTEKDILLFAARIHKPVETFGKQGIPSFSETIGDLTLICHNIYNDIA